MVEAATQFRKNGFNDEDAAQLGQIAAMYQNVSDEAVSASDSASFIISQMVAFGIEAENATSIIDSVNEVANNFSVSSGDLGKSLGIVASSSATMGNSMQETLGLLTAITEQTRNSSKAARGLNSVMANLAQVLDANSSNGKKIVEIYSSLGLNMQDANGQLLSGFNLLKELADVWDSLDGNTQKYIATTIAGTHQLNNFLALMTNFNHATEATDTALNSAGSAARENSRYMEGLEAKTQAVKASFEQLANTVVDSDLVKIVLDLSKGFLDLANNGFGAFVIQATALTGILWGGSGLLNAMKAVPAVLSGMGKGIMTFNGLLGLTAPQLAIIATGLTAIVGVGMKLKKLWDDATPSIEEANQRIEENSNRLEENQQRLEEINHIPWGERTGEILSEKDSLEAENAELEKQIGLLEKKKVKSATSNAKRTEEVYVGEVYKVPSLQTSTQSAGILEFKTYEEALDALNKKYGEATVQAKHLDEQIQKFGKTVEVTGPTLDIKLTQVLKQLSDEMIKNGQLTDESITLRDKNISLIREQAESYQILYENGQELTTTQREFLAVLGEFDSLSSQLNANLTITEEQYNKLIQVNPQLQNAIKQTNEGYQLEIDVLSKALAAGDQWAVGMMADHKELTKEAIQQTTARIQALQAEMELMKATANIGKTTASDEDETRYMNLFRGYTLASAALNKLNKIQASQNQGVSNPSFGSKTSSGGSGKRGSAAKAKDPIEEQNKLFKEQLSILEDRLYIMEKSGASEEEITEHLKKMQETVGEQANWFRSKGLKDESQYIRERKKLWADYYDKIQDLAEQSAEKAKKAWEDSLNAQIESLQGKVNEYEAAFSFVANKMQKEIDALEDQKQAINDRYDKEIEALQQENDELDRQIQLENALDALSRAKQTNVMVYKDGKFQYVQDVEAVSEAQANLDNLRREEQLRQEIEALEKSRDAEIAAIDVKIQYWYKMKEEWASVVEDYKDKQDELLAEQVLGIKLEGENWELRLSNLADYVARYQALLSSLTQAQQALDGGYTGGGGYSSGGHSGGGFGYGGGSSGGWSDAEMEEGFIGGSGSSGGSSGGGWSDAEMDEGFIDVGGSSSSGGWTQAEMEEGFIVPKYASGTHSAKGGISLVGENGPEMRLLNQGDGVLPSNITRNLWSWGEMTPSALIGDVMNGVKTLGKSINIAIENFNPNLPNVNDGPSFATYLRNNFWRDTLQFVKT